MKTLAAETDYLGGLIKNTLSHVLQYERDQSFTQTAASNKKETHSRKTSKKSLSPQEVDHLIEISQKIKDQLEREVA